jgi:two-component system, chemotaxis family, chemotaxis protein CheY
MRILVVDDSKAMRMIVKRHVGQAMPDAEFVEAENGAQALDIVRADTPDS